MFTRHYDDIGTPIYDGDTVLINERKLGKQYLGVVTFNGDFGGWCIRITAAENQFSPTGWVSLAGSAVVSWRTFKQYRRPLVRHLRQIRVSCRGGNTLISPTHLPYAQ